MVVDEAGECGVAESGAAGIGDGAEAAAADRAIRFRNDKNIHVVNDEFLVPIQAPFPDVAVHVIEAPIVRNKFADFVGGERSSTM